MPTSTVKVLNLTDAVDVHFNMAAAVERIYEAVFKVEDALASDGRDDPYDAQHLQEIRSKAIAIIKEESALDALGEERALLRFLTLMALPKAKRIIGRAIRAINNAALSDLFLTRIIEFFEYLDVGRHEAPEAQVELFINSVLAALVPYVAQSPVESMKEKIALLCGKGGALSWMVLNKAGVVLFCILLSRLEILKGDTTGATQDAMAPCGELLEGLFDAVVERLSDVFGSLSTPEAEFYGWQFMALLAMSVDADRKRQMVLELRERIMAVVQRGESKSIVNLNVFLNALGLDASQIAG
jgi:hypothetical protein